jgi:hypothetical protein
MTDCHGLVVPVLGHQRFHLVSKLPEFSANPDIGPEPFQKNTESKNRTKGNRIHKVSAFLDNEPHIELNSLKG